jgi:S-DNA-T family DNA segregation ATPase FtsK/SpoIIIE
VVLGNDWAKQGYTATCIDPAAQGVSLLLAEEGVPRRIKSAFLTDDQVATLADRAAELRRPGEAA